jgi:predicted nucleic acid-binding protein
MRVLLDTDVVLDFVLERTPYVEAAAQLLELHAKKRYQGFISSITPINVFYVGRKAVGAEKARLSIADLLATLEVCPVTQVTLISALDSSFSDYEDAVQYSSAVASGLDAIITRNVRDYKNSTLPIFTPAEFLQRLRLAKNQI